MDLPRRFAETNAVLSRSREGRGLTVVLSLLCVPVLLYVAADVLAVRLLEQMGAVVLGLGAFLLFTWPALAPAPAAAREEKGRLDADEAGLRFLGRPLLARSEIRFVTVDPLASGEALVSFGAARASKDLKVVLPGVDRAEALVAALGASGLRAARFRVARVAPRTRSARRRALVRPVLTVAALVALAAVLARAVPAWGLSIVPLLVAFTLVEGWLDRRCATELAVFADALVVGHGRSRILVPIAQVTSVRRDPDRNAVKVLVGGDEPLWLRFGDGERGDTARDAFVTAAREALAGRAHAPDVDPVSALLVRDARDDGGWAAALEAIGRADASYRTAFVPDEALWRVARLPTADACARIGAVVALRVRPRTPAEDAAFVTELRGMAEQTADDALGEALRRAAAGRAAVDVVAGVRARPRSEPAETLVAE